MPAGVSIGPERIAVGSGAADKTEEGEGKPVASLVISQGTVRLLIQRRQGEPAKVIVLKASTERNFRVA